MNNNNNQQSQGDSFYLVFGIIVIIAVLALFFWSLTWSWESYTRKMHQHVDWSWLKWVFYPILVGGLFFGWTGISLWQKSQTPQKPSEPSRPTNTPSRPTIPGLIQTHADLDFFLQELNRRKESNQTWMQQMEFVSDLKHLDLASGRVKEFIDWSYQKLKEGYPVTVNMTEQEAISDFNRAYNEQLVLTAEQAMKYKLKGYETELANIMKSVKPANNFADTVEKLNKIMQS